CRNDLWMSAQHALDGQRRSVLAVHPDPVAAATGEIDESGVIHVAQITGPVPAVADAFGVGGVVFVVALEVAGAKLVDDLADGFVWVEQVTVVVENRWRTIPQRRRIDDRYALMRRPTESPRRSRGIRLHRAASFTRAVALVQHGAEAPAELGLVVWRRLCAEPSNQAIVGIVGLLWGGHQIAECLSDIGEERRAEEPDVG